MAARSTAIEASRDVRRNWKIGPGEKLYGLAIIDTRLGNVLSFDKFNLTAQQAAAASLTTGSGFTRSELTNQPSEFLFAMNPKQLRMEEPAAVTIVPTQNGGQFIEHQGQIYKNITIAGTTGLRPNPKIRAIETPLDKLINFVAGPDLDGETGLPVGERTGFDDLIALRNLFRAYWSYKIDGDRAPHTLMVWSNIKEGEFYVVEPMNFSTERASTSPYTFNYNIALRTIERLDLKRTIPTDSLVKTSGLFQKIERISELSVKLTQALTVVRATQESFLLTGERVITQVISRASRVVDELVGIAKVNKATLDFPRNAINQIKDDAENVLVAVNELVAAEDPYQTQGILSKSAVAANACKSLVWSLSTIAAEDSLYTEQLSTRTSRRITAYRDPVTGNPRTGGDPTNLTNAPIPSGTKQSVVQSGETIRTAAKRLLGNTNLWRQLVVVNDLRAPYISQSGDGISVLRPNDPILVPSSAANAPENAVSTDFTSKSVQIDSLTQRLGRDIRLQADPVTGKFDFVVNSRGDLALVEGIENLEQAIQMKFSTEQGQLPVHPFYGVSAPIGEKSTVRSVIQFQTNARASLLSDTRIEDVVRFQARVDGNTLLVNTALRIRGADGAIGVSFGARR